MEPGLRGAYMGEDLFSDVHKALVNEGFWLSNLRVCGLVRMRKSTLDALSASDPSLGSEAVSKIIRPTPGWTECRYLRSLESLAKVGGTKRDYVLLWVFASIDKQLGFCLDLADEYLKVFGPDEVGPMLRDESVRQIGEAKKAMDRPKMNGSPTLFGRVKRKLKRVLWPGRPLG
jgi:hypothetical protein